MLTQDEKAINHDTWTHIWNVQKLLVKVLEDITQRALMHDQSKLAPPEVSTFAEFTPKLKDLVYGSDEYKACLAAMKPALDHHYASNRHHPEHHTNGVNDMTLLDLIEMVCDWTASAKRNASGDVRKGLDYNAERFGISPQLLQIIRNTIDVID